MDRDQMELVEVTHVEDSITFWAHSITSHEAFERMNKSLGEVCLKSQRLHGTPSINKIYGALFSKDNNWYRCKVQRQLDDKFMVSYIDYGNREMVCRSAIVELPEDLQSPSLAKKYKFWGLHSDPDSPNIKQGFLQNLMLSKTVRVQKRSVSFDGTILVQAFQGSMDIGEELIKMKLAQANVLWSQRENPPLKDPAVSWLKQMMERGQGTDGISTFPVCMPKLRPVLTDQKLSSAKETATNVSKPAIAAEKKMDLTNTVEKTMDVSNTVEKTMDVSNTVEKRMDVTNTVENTMDVTRIVEKRMDVTNIVEKRMDVTNTVENTMDVTNTLEKTMDVTNTLEKTMDVTNTLEKTMDVTNTLDNTIDGTNTVVNTMDVTNSMEKSMDVTNTVEKRMDATNTVEKAMDVTNTVENTTDVTDSMQKTMDVTNAVEKKMDFTVTLEEIQRLKAELKVQKQNCVQKEKELKDSCSEIQELKASNANLSKEAQHLETLVDDMTGESQQLQKRLQDADLTMQVMTEEIVKKEKEMDKLLHAGMVVQLGRLVEKVHSLKEIRKSLFAGDDYMLMEAFNTVIHKSMSAPVATEELEVAWKDYMCVQEKLRACEKQEDVKDLVDQRNKIRSVVMAAADRFLEEAKPLPVRERMDTLEEVSAALTAAFGLPSEEDVGEHIYEEYRQWVKEKEQHMTSIRDDSNNALNALSSWASNVAKFFCLTNETLVTTKDVLDGADHVLNLAELNVCRELDICLTKVGQIEQDSRVISSVFHKVMQDIQKEKKVLIDIMDKYLFHIKFKEMIEGQDVSPSPATLLLIKKNIRCLKTQLRWRQVEKNSLEEAEEVDLTEISRKSEEIAETRNLLFQEIRKEKEEYNKLRVLSEGEFPELPLLYPEVDLNIFMSSGGLLIRSLDRDLFDAESVKELSVHRPLVCTEFQGQRVILKSYTLNEEAEVRVLERTTLFHRAAVENKEDSGILPLLALFFSKSDPVAYLMVPYFPNGSLKVVQAVNPLTDTEVVRVMKGVACGLHALHAIGVTHGSLNPSNIFAINRNRGLVGDFDFTKTVEQRAVNTGVAGSIDLVAPELRQGITTPSPACDMFAFGCLMLWLHVPEFNGSLDDLEPLSLESKLRDLLSKLLVSGERLTAMEVLANEYFTVDL